MDSKRSTLNTPLSDEMIALGKTNYRRLLLCTLKMQFINRFIKCHLHTPHRRLLLSFFFLYSLTCCIRFKDTNWLKYIINPARLPKKPQEVHAIMCIEKKKFFVFLVSERSSGSAWEATPAFISFIGLDGRSCKSVELPRAFCHQNHFGLTAVARITSCHESWSALVH